MSQSPRILVSDEEYKVYKFSGLPIHWRRWKGRFIARATLKGFKGIPVSYTHLTLPTIA